MARVSAQAVYDRLPVALQELLLSARGYARYRARYGPPFPQILDELCAGDLRGADEVRADQERRLRDTVRHAARSVPYYRELFQREGIDPETIRTVEDLARLPMLDKDAVRKRARDLQSEAVAERDTTRTYTSGSTGSALPLIQSRDALCFEYAVVSRQRGWYGAGPGDVKAVFGGRSVVPIGQARPPFWRHDRGLGRTLFSLYHMTEANLESYADQLRRPGYRFWQGYPSSIGLICQYLLDHGIELGDTAPAAVFPSSETLLDFHRASIAQATHAVIADRYGNAEFSVSAVACPAGSLHVDTEFGVVEIDAHEETDEWVRGEVVTTGFANRAMPLLRYRTGDVATLRKRLGCPCGRARPVLERVDGRIEDYVVTPDGRRIGRMDHVFKHAFEVKEAQIHQPCPERIVVRYVPRPGCGDRVERELDREIRMRLGDEIEVRFERTDGIPRRANGKFRAVVSDIPGAQVG